MLLHILAVVIGLAALLLALRSNQRMALALLAPAWLTSGIIFHLTYYAELNWAVSGPLLRGPLGDSHRVALELAANASYKK